MAPTKGGRGERILAFTYRGYIGMNAFLYLYNNPFSTFLKCQIKW